MSDFAYYSALVASGLITIICFAFLFLPTKWLVPAINWFGDGLQAIVAWVINLFKGKSQQ